MVRIPAILHVPQHLSVVSTGSARRNFKINVPLTLLIASNLLLLCVSVCLPVIQSRTQSVHSPAFVCLRVLFRDQVVREISVFSSVDMAER